MVMMLMTQGKAPMGIQILAKQILQNHHIHRHFTKNATLKFKGFRCSTNTTGYISCSITNSLPPVACESASHEPTVQLSISESTKSSHPVKPGIQNNDEDDGMLVDSVEAKSRKHDTVDDARISKSIQFFCCPHQQELGRLTL
jgi:hypothetical protein